MPVSVIRFHPLWRHTVGAIALAMLLLCTTPSSQVEPPAGSAAPLLVCPSDYSTATHFRVVRPNGGEHFHIGDMCTVVVRADRPVRVGLWLEWDEERVPLPLDRALDPATDSAFVFAIPDSFTVHRYDPAIGGLVTIRISPVSDSCLIRVSEYGDPNVFDYSDCYFSIRPRPHS